MNVIEHFNAVLGFSLVATRWPAGSVNTGVGSDREPVPQSFDVGSENGICL